MTADELRGWCLGLDGAEETFPFNASTSVFKVGGRMFALAALSDEPLAVSLKCDPERGEALREAHASIAPGYHLNKRHWLTVTLGGDADDALVRKLIVDSHAVVARRGARRTPDAGLTPHARRNRAAWDVLARTYAPRAEAKWAGEPTWGMWDVPERELRVLPDVAGLDAIDLGCGTGFWSAWLARMGAHPTGVDNSARQLETARRMQREHGLDFPLIHGSAEAVPLPEASVDLALSEYGASIWCDPELWIPEAARLLRPGGLLAFLIPSPLFMLCVPDEGGALAGDRLLRPYYGMRSFRWPDEEGEEFNLTYGDWIGTLARNGFAVEALHEVRPPPDAEPPAFVDFVAADWAHRWPHEAVWVARRTG